MDFKYIFSPLDINNINKSYKMVKADAIEPKTWMEFVKEVRDKNPGMALKDILRLASKLRGKSSSGNSGKSSSGNSQSGKKQKKRGGMLLPMLGGEAGSGEAPAPEVEAPAKVEAPAPEQVKVAAPAVVEKLPPIPEGDENNWKGGRKSKKRSKKSNKSRKSKSKKTKRRH